MKARKKATKNAAVMHFIAYETCEIAVGVFYPGWQGVDKGAKM